MNNTRNFINILCDHPIEDASFFNFKEYVDSLTKIIQNPDNKPPFTIAINGDWGSGKTTLMKSLKTKLGEDTNNFDEGINFRKVKPVWFDAWKYSEKDSLLSALALEIYDNVVNDNNSLFDSSLKHRLKKWMFLSKQLKKENIAKDFLKFSLSSLSLVSGMPPLKYDNLNVSSWVDSPIDRQKLSYYSKFNDYLDTIIELYFKDSKSGNKGNLVIFIDDLDRCPPDSVAEILEAINLFFDKGQCIFVIGMDIPKVASMVEAYYDKYNVQTGKNESINNTNSFSGEEYLKKMIQIQLNLLPIHAEDLKEYIKSSYGYYLPEIYDFDFVIESLKETNLREIKRFFNVIILILEIKKSIKTKNDLRLDIKDELFVKWQLLDFLFPDLTKIIKCEPFLLLALNNYANDKDSDPFYDSDYMELDYGLDDENFTYFTEYSQKHKIIEILKSGDFSFEINSIEACIFLFSFTQLISKNEGSVTITASGDGDYFSGEKINFSGTCTASNKVYLFLKGSDLPENGVKLNDSSIECVNGKFWTFSLSNVHYNGVWEFTFDTKQIKRNLPEGNYTIYAVSGPYFNPISERQKYDTISIVLKKPFITATPSASTFVIGSEFIIRGIAKGNPDHVYIWIIGDEGINYHKINVEPTGSFEFIFKDNTVLPGQYLVILQHPLLKEKPDVYYKNNQIILNSDQSIHEIGSNAFESAKIILDLINSPDCEDIYCNLSFIAEEQTIKIESIGNHRIGDSFAITGSTNLPVKSSLIADISYVSEEESSPKINPSFSMSLLVKEGTIYNNWSLDIDSSAFKPGKYRFRIHILETDKKAEEFFDIQ